MFFGTPQLHTPRRFYFQSELRAVHLIIRQGLPKMGPDFIIKAKFKRFWKHYVLQSLLATVALAILTLAMGRDKIVLISAIAATTFIVFALPFTNSAKPKNVIGSHIVGVACGAIFSFTTLPHFVEWSLAVGIAIFFMLVLGVIHPPAAGTALAVAINQAPFETLITIVTATVLLSLCRYLLRKHLKTLL